LLIRASVYRVPVERTALEPAAAMATCLETGLLTPGTAADGPPTIVVHRWTAAALTKRAVAAGLAPQLADAHARAARYWRSRAGTPAALQEAHHHLVTAADLVPGTGVHDLAAVCDQLREALGRAGRRQDAADVSGQHLDLRRRMNITERSTRHAAELAAALVHHTNHLADAGRLPEGLTVAAEAVEAYGQLATEHPEFTPELAGALVVLGVRLADAGRPDHAVGATVQAVQLYLPLLATDPVRHGPGIATALNNLGADLTALDRSDEALTATAAAIELFGRLAHERGFTMALHNLSLRLFRLGHRETALSVAALAVETYRRLADREPAVYQPSLAVALGNLSGLLADAGQTTDSLIAAEAAVDIQRRLTATEPAAFRTGLVESLARLADVLTALSRPVEAAASLAEAEQLSERPRTNGQSRSPR
jgi:tetratricopeptide (TPR) repeat protein